LIEIPVEMSSLRPKLILPLLLGIGMLWVMPLWKSLVQFEHFTFVYLERFQEDHIFSEIENPADFKIKTLDFSGSDESHLILTYVIDDKTKDILGDPKLTPTQWAYFLTQIREEKEGLLVIATPLSWPQADEISLLTLDHEISQIPNLALGLTATLGTAHADLPPYLTNSTIGKASTTTLKLPQINDIPIPPSVTAPLFGIALDDQFFNEEWQEQLKIPMLVRWDDQILPSLPLASLLAAHQLPPSGLIIDPRGYLRFGRSGTILKIDEEGKATFPQAIPSYSSASNLLTKANPLASSKILVSPATPESIYGLSRHISHALNQKPTPLKTYQRWSLPIEISALLILTLLLQTRLLLLIIPSVAALFAISTYLGHWFLLAPVLLILITFFLLKKRPPSKPEKETSPLKQAKEKPAPQKTAPAKKAASKKSIKPTVKKVAKEPAKKGPKKPPKNLPANAPKISKRKEDSGRAFPFPPSIQIATSLACAKM
jgi:hypothetical protein